QSFTYEAISGPVGKRDPDDVSFTIEVTQSIAPVALASVKGLVPTEYSKDLEVKPLAEIHLKTSERDVRQIWQASRPWPVYSSNGTTVSKLVRVLPRAER